MGSLDGPNPSTSHRLLQSGHAVRNPREAIDRLKFVLEATGGSMDDDDVDSLSPRTRAIEDAVKQVILYLQMMGLMISIETSNVLFLPRIWAIS